MARRYVVYLTLLTLVLVLFSTGSYAGTSPEAPCPDFFNQNPTPFTDWTTVASPSPNVAWAVSLGGWIIKTVDGGRTWKPQWSPAQYWRDTPPLYAVTAPSNNVAWICSENGIVIITANGGESWSVKNVGSQVDLKGISALNGRVAWTVGVDGNVFRTSNGGKSWANSKVGGAELDGVCALSTKHAWVAGGGTTVAETTDGGAHWDLKDLSAFPAAMLTSVQVLNGKRAYAIGNNYFFRSTDGGANWSMVNFGSKITVMDMSFSDAYNGWICGTDSYNAGFLTTTSDGGKHWSRRKPTQLTGERNVTGISSSSPGSVYATSVDAALLFTKNAGSTWNRYGKVWTRETLVSTSAIDQRSAWVAGEGGRILRTFNGGRSWVTQNTNVKEDLAYIDAVDSATAWAVGAKGTIIKTTDYGTTWLKQSSGTSADLTSISAINGNEAWACGDDVSGNGYVLHTTNGGKSWRRVRYLPGMRVSSVAAWDSKRAWFGAADNPSSYIYRTADGGNTWQRVTLQRPYKTQKISEILGLKPVSKDTCLAIVQTSFLVDNWTWMYRTENGGSSWNKVGKMSIFADGNLFNLATLDGRTIWGCGASLNPYAEPTVVYKTENGGGKWVNGKAFHRTVMFGMDMADDGTMWTVGYVGTIFRSTVPSIFSIAPDAADNIGTVRIADIAGSGFSDGMEVWLEKGGTRIKAEDVEVGSPYKATCQFNLDGAPLGAYDVVTRNINGMEDRLVQGFNVTTPKDWFLAEGSTGTGNGGAFETWVTVQNPNAKEAKIDLTYMTPSGQIKGPSFVMAPESRQTVNVGDTVPNEFSVSTRVVSDRPVVVERAMYWNSEVYRQSATGSLGLSHLSKNWYLPEGSTGAGADGAFETWVVLQNPGSNKAAVKLTYMTPQGRKDGPALIVEPGTRRTVNVADSVPGEWSVSTLVESNVPVAAEKAMYWSGAQYRQAALESIGTSGPAREWYLAEGSTGADSRGNFENWVVIENPFDHAARARLYYQLTDRQVEGPEVLLEPYTRKTVNVADTVPNQWSVATRVVADAPVVAERSTYWSSAAHRQCATGSIGVTAPHTQWLSAEGSTGRDANGSFETWIVVQNPGKVAADVKLTYQTPGGPVEGPAFKLAPGTRQSISVANTVKDNWSVATQVESDRLVVAERVVYWSGVTEFWRSAQASCAYPPR